MCTAFLCALIYSITTKFGPVLGEVHDYDSAIPFVVMFHGIFNQGWDLPERNSTRTAFCATFSLGLLTWSCFSAVLTSVLADAQNKKPPFASLDEMLYDTSFSIVTVSDSAFMETFKVELYKCI